MRKSVISHPPKERFVELRTGYQAIVGQDDCAAMLLSIFEHWTNYKLGQRNQAEHHNQAACDESLEETQDTGLWIYKSNDDLSEELLGHYSGRVISRALKTLLEYGFLLRRTNPKYGWDRTLQYLFVTEVVQAALDAWVENVTNHGNVVHTAKRRDAYRKNDVLQAAPPTIPQKGRMEGAERRDESRKKERAIPQDTTQDIPQDISLAQIATVVAPSPAKPQLGESLANVTARPQGKPKAHVLKVEAEIRQPMFDVVAPLLVGSEDPVAIKAAASQISGVVKSLLEVEITTPEETARVGQYIRDQRPSGDDGVIRLQTWRERIPEYLGYRASGKAWPKFGSRTGGKAGHAGTQEEIEARAAQLAKRYETPLAPTEPTTPHEDDEENLCPAF